MSRSGDDGIRLLETDVCNSPCDSLLKSVDDFADGRSELDADEKRKLVDAFEDSDGVSDDVPGGDPEQVQNNLEYLADEGVDGLDGTIGDISGDRNGYTGLAGEVKTAKRVVENQNDADVEMRRDVDPDDIADEDIPDGLTRSDDFKAGTTDIDVNDRNGAAYESKNNVEFTPLYDDISAYRSVGDKLDELRRKLNTIAASGQDEIVIVMREGELESEYSDDVTNAFPESVQAVERPTDLADMVEDNFDGVSVEFRSYEEVGS